MPCSISSPKAKIVYSPRYLDQAARQGDRALQEKSAEAANQEQKGGRGDISNRAWHGIGAGPSPADPFKLEHRGAGARGERSGLNAERSDSKAGAGRSVVAAQDDKGDQFEPAGMQP